MGNKMTLSEKELALQGLNKLFIIYTTDLSAISSGLCITTMYQILDMGVQEATLEYIKNHKSIIEWINYKFIHKKYYYKPLTIEPRIKYLSKHIKKLKKELGYK